MTDKPASIYEITGEMFETPHFSCGIAGLQYYDYYTEDELIGVIKPKVGDRIQLIRTPKNRHDKNAIEIWFRDARLQLGHIPRDIAEKLAPLMDAGANIRAFAFDEGDGFSWSSEVILFHDDLPEDLVLKHFNFMVEEADWTVACHLAHDPHSKTAPMSARDAEYEEEDNRLERLAQRAKLLAELLVTEEDLKPPAFPKDPPRSSNNKSFRKWDDIPEGLHTKTQWSRMGFKLKKRVRRAWADITYYKTRTQTVTHDLYATSQVEHKKQKSIKQLAAMLARKS